MADRLTGVSIDGLPQVLAIVQGLPEAAQEAAGDAGAEYIRNLFQQQPPPRYVTRRAAYGVPFFTERQRRWFFAALADGSIEVPYKRTQGLRRSWQIIGRGVDKIIVSETEAAVWTMSDDMQSRHEALVGWRTVGDIVEAAAPRLAVKLQAAVDKAMRKLGAK